MLSFFFNLEGKHMLLSSVNEIKAGIVRDRERERENFDIRSY